jgi:hypothetical protein
MESGDWRSLHRLWEGRTRAAGSPASPDWSQQVRALYAFGISLEDALQFLYQSKPDWPGFRAWISARRRNPARPDADSGEQVLSAEDLRFWDENGYLVLRGAVPRQQCLDAQAAIWEFLGASADNPASWYRPHDGKNGLMLRFSDHPALERNRNSTHIRQAYRQLYCSGNLFKSIDKVSFNPPETDTFRFLGDRLHWDVSLRTPVPFKLQGLLYLGDCGEQDGAFQCVPGFHRRLEDWLAAVPPGIHPRDWAVEVLAPHTISGAAGDFIIWHQALPHCASPNRGRLPRLVQYLTYFRPTAPITPSGTRLETALSPNNANPGLMQLQQAAAAILSSGPDLWDAFPHVEALRRLAEQVSGVDFSANANSGVGESRLASGLAISPMMAAWCAREPLRSAAFIRGVARAFAQAARSRADAPVRVLYAGCGPFALLVLPLMAVMPASRLRVTLIDIHREALDYARKLVASLGLEDRVAAWVHGDATEYRIDPAAPPDVIVSETMSAALAREPQVSITRHLLAQAPHALLVPAVVRVDCLLCNPAREKPNEISPLRDRIHVGHVFQLDADAVLRWADLQEEWRPPPTITLPAVIEPRYQVRLLTHIEVFDGIALGDYACSLNTPRFLPGKPLFTGGERLQFRYRLGGNPGLDFLML